MEYLLANGCSWTDPNYNPKNEKYFSLDHKFVTWPEVLGRSMNLYVVNIGLAGSSNRSIISRTFDYLVSHENYLPEYCFIQLSQWDRFNLVSMHRHYHIINALNILGLEQKNKFNPESLTDWERVFIDSPDEEQHRKLKYNVTISNAVIAPDGPGVGVSADPADFINETLRNLYMLYSYCSKNNVKLFVFQGFQAWSIKKFYKYLEEYGLPEQCEFTEKQIFRLHDVNSLQRCWDNNIFVKKLSEAEDNKNLILYNWPFFNISTNKTVNSFLDNHNTDITSLISKETYQKFIGEGLSHREADNKLKELMHIIPNMDSHPSEWTHDRIAQLIHERLCS